MDLDNAFLTEVDVKSKAFQDPKLSGVRKDYIRVMEVVASFGDKVNNMVDKQREEYMHAYEQHMYDVQKELHQLREKVTEIANDKTRDEKIKQLSEDQVKYRHEALFYDEEAALLRKKIKRIKGMLHSAERERDWLLKKLREEKKRYLFLKEERTKYAGFNDANSSMTSVSNDSMYSIELMHDRSVQKAVDNAKYGPRTIQSRDPSTNWRARLEADVLAVNRDQGIVSTLPFLTNQQSTLPAITSNQSMSMSRLPQQSSGTRQSPKKRDKQAVAELVTLRARQEGIRDFVSQCAACCRKGVWAKMPRRHIQDLLMEALEISNNPEASDEDRMSIIQDLVVTPETYFAVNDLLVGKTEAVINSVAQKWGMQSGASNFDEYYDEGQEDAGDRLEDRMETELGGDDDDEWTPLDLDKLETLDNDCEDEEAAKAVLRLDEHAALTDKRSSSEPVFRLPDRESYGSQSVSVLPPIKASRLMSAGRRGPDEAAPLLDLDTLEYFRQHQQQLAQQQQQLLQQQQDQYYDDEEYYE